MADFIRMCSDFFKYIIDMLIHNLEGMGTLIAAAGNILSGYKATIDFFPSFLSGIMLCCVAALILLRVVGR